MFDLKIGNTALETPVLLAPMAGITDLPFRLICKEMGCAYMTTEMVSAKALYYHNTNTDGLMQSCEEERPVAVQLFGSDADVIAQMAEQLPAHFCAVDFNMGCPVPKIVNNGEGSALMRNPKLAEEILSKLVRHAKVPVTVKMRKGFSESEANAPELARIAEACGVSAIVVHGRTREQYYSGRADIEVIRQVKEAVRIPVIGNGDVDSVAAAVYMMQTTGCDGVMVGRGVKGNPWLIRDLCRYFREARQAGGWLKADAFISEARDRQTVYNMILKHCALQMKYKGEYTAVREMRKHIAWYTNSWKHSAPLRNAVNHADSMEEIAALLQPFCCPEQEEECVTKNAGERD